MYEKNKKQKQKQKQKQTNTQKKKNKTYINKHIKLPDRYFGEQITFCGCKGGRRIHDQIRTINKRYMVGS